MIPRVHRGSRTFGGRLRYLSRNGRGENPTELALENLPDPGGDDNHARLRIAGKVMHSTATNADNLKKLAGGSMRGRRLQQPCHHVTLSWLKGQNPTGRGDDRSRPRSAPGHGFWRSTGRAVRPSRQEPRRSAHHHEPSRRGRPRGLLVERCVQVEDVGERLRGTNRRDHRDVPRERRPPHHPT